MLEIGDGNVRRAHVAGWIALAGRRPFAAAAVGHPVGAACVVCVLAATVLPVSRLHEVSIPWAIVVQGYLALLGALALTALGWWREVGFLRGLDRDTLRAFAPISVLPVLIVAGVFIAGASVSEPTLILGGALAYLLGAFGEEALFRGVVLQAYLVRRGAWHGIVASTAFFGLQHLASFAVGLPLAEALVQMVMVAPLVGFGFAAARLATGHIWPLVGLHALINYGSYLAQGEVLNTAAASMPDRLVWTAPLVLLELIVLPVYGAWLLRNRRVRFADAGTATPRSRPDEARDAGHGKPLFSVRCRPWIG